MKIFSSIEIKRLQVYPLLGYLIAGLIVYTNIHEQLASTSMLITMSFLYVLLGLFLKLGHFSKFIAVPVVLCVLFSMINVSINHIGTFDEYKKVIMFAASMLWMLICVSTHINKSTGGGILLINLLVSFLYLLNFDKAYSITEDGLLMTFNFTNANQAGMFLMNTALYLCIIMLTDGLFQNKLLRLLCLPLIVAIIAFVFFTGCRSSLGALAFFLILVSIDFISRGNFKLKRWHVAVWALSPLLFAFLYMAFIQSLDIDTSFGIEDHGKDNTTRLGVWSKGLAGFTDYALFGDYYNLERKIGFSHMHNIHLDVLVCYGLIPFIFYVIALFRSAWRTHLRSNGKIQRLSLYAFITCIVSGFFEATLVSGSGGLFLFSFGFLLLANMKDDELQYQANRKPIKYRIA